MGKEIQDCFQSGLPMLLSLHHLIMTKKYMRKSQVEGNSADPAMENSMVGELGGPRGHVAELNQPKMADKVSSWEA